jgi:thiol-disulfide isomerase/thioredoxin
MISPVDASIDAATGLIAVVLLVSGLSKLRTPDRTLMAMADLRVPRFARRRWIAALVPVLELALAAGLVVLPGWGRLAASAAALLLFLVFTWFVVGVIRRGEQVTCDCFGSLSRDPIDRWTVVRNVVLVVASAVALGAGPFAPSLVVRAFTSGVATLWTLAALWVLMLAIALAVGTILRQRRHIDRLRFVINDQAEARTRRVAEGPLEGSRIPEAELVTPTGTTLPLSRLSRGRAVLLIFVGSGCGDCAEVARAFPEWQQRIGTNVRLLVATSARPDELEKDYPEFGDSARFGALAARQALGVRMVPSAVVLGSNGLVASEVVEGSRAIADLVDGLAAAIAQATDGR